MLDVMVEKTVIATLLLPVSFATKLATEEKKPFLPLNTGLGLRDELAKESSIRMVFIPYP